MRPIVCLALAAALVAAPAFAAPYVITLKDSTFTPATLVIPANQKVTVTVKNMNDKPAEFESDDLDREKVVAAKGEISVFIGPVAAGSYSYDNDFDESAKGTIVAK